MKGFDFMKVRVYYGETEEYNYIAFIRGNKIIVFYDEYNFIDIKHEKINTIVNNIKFNIAFDGYTENDFIDLYNDILHNPYSRRAAGELSRDELFEILHNAMKIYEIE